MDLQEKEGTRIFLRCQKITSSSALPPSSTYLFLIRSSSHLALFRSIRRHIPSNSQRSVARRPNRNVLELPANANALLTASNSLLVPNAVSPSPPLARDATPPIVVRCNQQPVGEPIIIDD